MEPHLCRRRPSGQWAPLTPFQSCLCHTCHLPLSWLTRVLPKKDTEAKLSAKCGSDRTERSSPGDPGEARQPSGGDRREWKTEIGEESRKRQEGKRESGTEGGWRGRGWRGAPHDPTAPERCALCQLHLCHVAVYGGLSDALTLQSNLFFSVKVHMLLLVNVKSSIRNFMMKGVLFQVYSWFGWLHQTDQQCVSSCKKEKSHLKFFKVGGILTQGDSIRY